MEKGKVSKKSINWRSIMPSIAKGVALVVIIWWINAFIAFVPFSRESNTRVIIATWIVVDAVFVYALVKIKQIDRMTGISALIFILILVGLYFVPVNSNIPDDVLKLNKKISEKHENKYDYAKELFFEVEKKYGAPIRQY